MNGVKMVMPLPETVTTEAWANMARAEIEEQLLDIAEENYERMEAVVGSEELRKFEKRLMLQVLDTLWVRHLTALDALRQGIGLRAIAQQDPLVAYQKEGFAMYGQLRDNIKSEVVHHAFRPTVIQQAPRPKNVQAIHPSAEAATANVTAETAGSAPEAPPQPVRVSKTPGRNDLCYCGSGKKYKHCHEKLDRMGANGSATQRGAQAAKPNKAKRR
jgi:preprotein translocase subunit SecA